MNVCTSDDLNKQDIEALIAGEIYVLHVKAFYNLESSEKLSELIIDSERFEYTHEIVDNEGNKDGLDYGVQTGCQLLPFNQVFLDPRKSDEYFREAVDGTLEEKIRNLALTKNVTTLPGDHLVGALEKEGFQVQKAAWGKKPMRAGLFRITKPEAMRLQDSPHIDSLQNVDFNAHSQFGANIFLRMPETGGDLLLWNIKSPLSAETAKNMEADKKLFNTLINTGECCSIRPSVGDLIIVNTRVPHAVSTYSSNTPERVGYNEFLCLKDPDGPFYRYS